MPCPSASFDTSPCDAVLLDALAGGATLLLPNERAVRDLRQLFDSRQSASGLAAWNAAAISSWNSWASSQWAALITSGHESRLLLNPPQERLLWRDLLADADSLSSLDALANLAASAWARAADYDSLDDIRHYADTHDARTFAAWATAFRNRCETRQYLPEAQLAATLRQHVQQGHLQVPGHLILVGFEHLNPARQSLLDALDAAGCNIEIRQPQTDSPASIPTERHTVSCANPQQELLTAARWIRAFAEEHGTEVRPPRIALITPALADEREELAATLRHILAPELDDISVDASSAPFTFPSGEPLAHAPLAHTALDILHWLSGPLPLDRVSNLLLSPYLGGGSSSADRAAFDAFHLRRAPLLRPELGPADLLRIAASTPYAAQIRPLFRPLAERAAQLSATDLRRDYSDWMEFVRDALRDVQWPVGAGENERTLTPLEFQTHRAWEHALDAVATLDFSGHRVDFPTALAALESQSQSAAVPPLSSNAFVQVMSPSDAAGSTFDAIVFLHATDANWPAAERAHPLLSWRLQRERNMPGAEPNLTSDRAAQITAHLAAAAPNILFFHPREDETGHQRLAPIVAGLGLESMTAEALIPPTSRANIIATETFEDATPLPPLPSAEVRGGTRLLKLQAACAFLAFAEMRLGATAIEAPTLGLNPMQLGEFVHSAMSTFWSNVNTQQKLAAMSPLDRAEALRAAVESAIPKLTANGTWDQAYIDLQKERMVRLLDQWLDMELERGPFRILELEQKKRVTVGPLSFQLRIDRIDAVDIDGGETRTVLIDYKTGASVSPKDWEGERPDEPQLPLYALLPEAAHLQAIAFARVRTGKEMKWLGYASAPGILFKPAQMPFTDMPAQIEAWRAILEKLAHDFFHGVASVSPKIYPGTCKHCAQRLLCRLDASTLTAVEDDEDADARL